MFYFASYFRVVLFEKNRLHAQTEIAGCANARFPFSAEYYRRILFSDFWDIFIMFQVSATFDDLLMSLIKYI